MHHKLRFTVSCLLSKAHQNTGKIFFDVQAMVKQLGIPTFFMTLSCADLQWNQLIGIISKLTH